ncbi:hypothetical protein PXK00_18025 [Phaeobacter sp. QD34_3]|uniref:hypothetical protein n=1 Tax=unclassified Phaeobacter TaxID=2621772 RepID=UPI00237EF464|nr:MULTISPECIES: hypothetical protein [unclassified Phaeobacter]MDE4135012.1 hypothetical protein [Phaeobacter sp. QD34_3]MDE4138642.1 hypothetical protein [Phaeobacter sp. QD34_24]
MHALADTTKLTQDGVITADQARIIESRAREAMVTLGVNVILCLGILAATGGFIFWLAEPLPVAIAGLLMTAGGLVILARMAELFRMFGNAATLIGAGMLIGGATLELMESYEDSAGLILAPAGGALLAGLMLRYWRGGLSSHFVLGSLILMALAVHIIGIEALSHQHDIGSPLRNIEMLYYAALLAGVGALIDVRMITALALAPFAQALETGSAYFHAAYVFYSPEPTLSILQMALLIALCLWFAKRQPERMARHLRSLVMLAFVVANLCALVGSLWGDYPGETLWGPGRYSGSAYEDWESFDTARTAFRDHAFELTAGTYSVLWALLLAGMVIWAAQRNERGLFNAALTFGGIHAYTQLFESFADEPLAYVIGGLAAIPLAWGIWRLNGWISTRQGVG